jgi:cell shape-determining protein MreC
LGCYGKVTDKKFIAAFIDSSFFKRSFVDDALDNIENEITDIQDTIKKRMEKGRSIEDLQNELTRYKALHNNLPSIVQKLKDSLSVNISGDNFDRGMDKIIDSIK